MDFKKVLVGGEVERAAMAAGIYPAETALEAAAKRQLARALAYAATALDPNVVLQLQRTWRVT